MINIKSHFLLPIIVLSFSAHCTENVDQFYSTSFLKNYTAVRTSLKEQGFTEVTFKTSDNLTLHGLFLSRPDATCNVILCAGWFPGKKEGLATFFDLLPHYCNVLLFDARGRGESEGPLLKNVWRYGINEYKDIIGAISYTNQQNALPIIIGGFCSGAFNATHALIDLEKNNKIAHYNIKGLIFDSGWGSITNISDTAITANVDLGIIMILKRFYQTTEHIKRSFFYKLSSNVAHCMCNITHFLLTKRLVGQYEPTTSLFNKIDHLTVPIFFIHSHDDNHANIDNAIKLSQLTQHKKCWWIQQSYHTRHHLVHRDLYKEKLTAFIDNVIQ